MTSSPPRITWTRSSTPARCSTASRSAGGPGQGRLRASAAADARCCSSGGADAPLETWQQDILGIIRDEAYYLLPQAMTKTMNEGWAVYWHPN